MNTGRISQALQRYVDNGELAGCALLVRKDGELVYDGKFGCADLKTGAPVTDRTIFRMASMTKCITAAAVLKMIEDGRMGLDDPVSKYLPAFAGLQVADDPRYVFKGKSSMVLAMLRLPFFRMGRVKRRPARRQITIRDLLSHASGLEMGIVGLLGMMKHNLDDTLVSRVDAYSRFVLDFEPGTATGYSPCASFDILGYILELVSGKPVEEHLRETLFEPLGMADATFHPTPEQKARTARVYTKKGRRLADVTGTKKDLEGIVRVRPDSPYTACCGGLYCTAKDYERFGRMLCSEGVHEGRRFLKPKTVALMRTEAQSVHLEPEPGYTWGLGVKIRQDPVRGNSPCTAGTYGWSGALGTHFLVSPRDSLELVFAASRADLGGSGSYISAEVEKLVFGTFV